MSRFHNHLHLPSLLLGMLLILGLVTGVFLSLNSQEIRQQAYEPVIASPSPSPVSGETVNAVFQVIAKPEPEASEISNNDINGDGVVNGADIGQLIKDK